jgi:hypothetical protein
MSFMDFLGTLKGDFLKSRLIAMGIEPYKLEGVDFNNMEQLNQLAETIMPEIIKRNPNIKNLLRQNSNLAGEKQKEVVDIIDKL